MEFRAFNEIHNARNQVFPYIKAIYYSDGSFWGVFRGGVISVRHFIKCPALHLVIHFRCSLLVSNSLLTSPIRIESVLGVAFHLHFSAKSHHLTVSGNSPLAFCTFATMTTCRW